MREPSQLASADSWTSVIIAAVRCGALVMVQRREQAGGRIVSKYVQPRALHAPPALGQTPPLAHGSFSSRRYPSGPQSLDLPAKSTQCQTGCPCARQGHDERDAIGPPVGRSFISTRGVRAGGRGI